VRLKFPASVDLLRDIQINVKRTDLRTQICNYEHTAALHREDRRRTWENGCRLCPEPSVGMVSSAGLRRSRRQHQRLAGRVRSRRGPAGVYPAATCAELFRFKGIFCDDPEQMGRGAPHQRPVLLEVKTDPETPPLPPHIKLEMMKKMRKAMLKDDERWGIMEKSMKCKAAEFKEKLRK
jgi:hypothetical protein